MQTGGTHGLGALHLEGSVHELGVGEVLQRSLASLPEQTLELVASPLQDKIFLGFTQLTKENAVNSEQGFFSLYAANVLVLHSKFTQNKCEIHQPVTCVLWRLGSS